MYEQLKLDHQICFPLYALSKEIIRRYTPFLAKLNLTYPQYLVMLVLWEGDGQTVNQIGAKLHLDSGTLTPLLKRLQAKELIKRERSQEDERVVRIFLTPSGKDLADEACTIPEHMARCLNLEANEVALLRKIVGKLAG
ncbi:MarR family transcriptional regulator [Avibacterium sp. 20-15]|uniref:MarR family winged helix-turn-helix transcriptional regulator n=1 Tax=unclassified Avibacterium TaxID=2685287 RepID=UPI002027504C|nr:MULTISPECIES: MarR family transcriptional regulator [unclassified Avibacterium]MCW9731975.1 MarR family transcriptional regulator [Avibacterium sp. 20-15]URL04162.1 MarR family transcriptional regulator [Avibacterium sp. 20-132]